MVKRNRSLRISLMPWLITLCLMLTCLPLRVRADLDIPLAPSQSQMVRVYLKRLGITDRMDLSLASAYGLALEDGTQLHFQPGSNVSFLLRDGSIYLYYEDLSLCAGKKIMLQRTTIAENEENGFYLTHFPALYMGDLTLDVSEGLLRPVLSIHVEDYLLGVVPYEMSDSFPLEALKAQAVAARTYALRRQNAYPDYDVVDTTNDQVFKGYVKGNLVAEQAVRETRGVCGFYKNQLAQCFYSASNGGQMELPGSVWHDRSSEDPYYTFGEDPYDVENPLSVVRSFVLEKAYADQAPYALRKLLVEKLNELLSENGLDAAPESIRVDSISEVRVDQPEHDQSKRMTMLHLTLQLSGRTRTERLAAVEDPDTEDVSMFWNLTDSSAALVQKATFAPVTTAVPQESPKPLYGPFVPLNVEISLSIPIFPEAEDVFGMDISANYENEIWSVAETENAFTLEARRYGHGVGMSQRGAQWMAGSHGMEYRQILGFYYPGMALMRYPEEAKAIAHVDANLMHTAGPAPSPTPRPTAMPMTLQAGEGEWYASVTEIADDSSLNLRAEPSLNGVIVMRLYKGQRLLVQERCPEEGWVKVRTDFAEGYVMEKYLTNE